MNAVFMAYLGVDEVLFALINGVLPRMRVVEDLTNVDRSVVVRVRSPYSDRLRLPRQFGELPGLRFRTNSW